MRNILKVFVGAAALVTGCQSEATGPAGPMAPESPLFAKAPSNATSLWKLPLDGAGLGLVSDGRQSDGTFSVYDDGICGVTGTIFTTGSGDATLQTNNPRQKNTTCQTPRSMTVVYPVGDPVYASGGTETMLVFLNVRNISNATTNIAVGYANHVERNLALNPSQRERCDAWRWSDEGVAGDKVWVERMDATTYHVYSKDLDPVVENRVAGANKAVCTTTGQAHHLPVDLYVVSKQPLP